MTVTCVPEVGHLNTHNVLLSSLCKKHFLLSHEVRQLSLYDFPKEKITRPELV